MEQRKLLEDLTTEEIKSLLSANKKFKEMCEEYAQENADFWNEEILKPFARVRGINYEISLCRYSYIDIGMGAYKPFLEGCEKLAHDFCIFDDTQAERINRALTRTDFYEECLNGYIDISETRFNHLNTWLESLVNDLKNVIIKEVLANYESVYDNATLEETAETVADTYGTDYETDGLYLYETQVRKYA